LINKKVALNEVVEGHRQGKLVKPEVRSYARKEFKANVVSASKRRVSTLLSQMTEAEKKVARGEICKEFNCSIESTPSEHNQRNLRMERVKNLESEIARAEAVKLKLFREAESFSKEISRLNEKNEKMEKCVADAEAQTRLLQLQLQTTIELTAQEAVTVTEDNVRKEYEIAISDLKSKLDAEASTVEIYFRALTLTL